MPPLSISTYSLTVPQSAIDEYGHVNNVIYVQWIQDAAIRHGEAVDAKLPENTGWFIREHRIEYLASAFLGDEIEISTWVSEWKRVRAQRRYEFIRKSDGKVIAKGETQWIFVELATGRPIQIPDDMIALFPIPAEQTDSTASTP
jgi:acyl-CoA thioester hydrolase